MPQQSESVPAKRKPSPIRFESKGDVSTAKDNRKQTRQMYEPPKNQFSKSLSNGNFQELEARSRSRGALRGRTGRGRGTWKQS